MSTKKDFVLIPILLLSSLVLSSCSAKQLTSEAYRFGKDTGTKWRELSSEVEALSTWAGEESDQAIEIPEVEKESACKAMWILIGWPKFGLKNMSENRTDFVDGCLTTIGS
jgi:hypothetical protein